MVSLRLLGLQTPAWAAQQAPETPGELLLLDGQPEAECSFVIPSYRTPGADAGQVRSGA